MKIIGLTGPSGVGKSCCASFFESIGFPIIDADKVYHTLIEKDSPCVRELVAEFGREILNDDLGVDRKVLGNIVFSGQFPNRVERLNQITHKFVKVETFRLIDLFKSQGASAVIIDAPLLFEADFHLFCDFCISVLAPRDLRLSRIIARDDLSEVQAKNRIASQKEDSYYIKHSDYIIINDSDIKNLIEQMKKILKKEGFLNS